MTPGEQYGALLRDARWQKKRLKILARDNNRCAKCGKARAGMNVHHKQYMPDAKPWDVPDSFLETLCPACHRGHHAEENQRARTIEQREFERETADPVPFPVKAIDTPIGIYRVTLGISTYVWLCMRHVVARRGAGWACERTGGAEWLTCDDCTREARS